MTDLEARLEIYRIWVETITAAERRRRDRPRGFAMTARRCGRVVRPRAGGRGGPNGARRRAAGAASNGGCSDRRPRLERPPGSGVATAATAVSVLRRAPTRAVACRSW